MKIKIASIYLILAGVMACSSGNKVSDSNTEETADIIEESAIPAQTALFNADSAYYNVEKQVNFGPRVPGSASHKACGEWLAEQLGAKGSKVTIQDTLLHAFDGTRLPTRNILGQFNPQKSDRILLVAHWDTRPWADQDPNPENRDKPVPGANDGASGVGVLLEVARVLGTAGVDKGIDILFVDSEDYGSEGDEESWALGARAFVENPPIAGYKPERVILLDMVGGKGSTFRREMFSAYNAGNLLDAVWTAASRAGHSDLFVNHPGGGITDDHVEFLKAGIPAIDIIALTDNGFLSTWHTLSDNMENIDREVLKAVGRTVLAYLYQ
ncbi:MAG: M28 family peptidase [Prevotella sp.]|nr:M28 family peptidase [Prevotella sp.]MCM1074571.1 M28 family peptidase [Ruminococcus sp.]